MSDQKTQRKLSSTNGTQAVTISSLAKYLKLSPAAVSMVLNSTPKAKRFPEKTKKRILAAAAKFNYRPNFVARSLRKQQTFTIGVLVPEVSEGYAALVLAGIEDYLLQAGYFYFVVSHRHKTHLLEQYPRLFMERLVEGIIAVDTAELPFVPDVPVTVVSGHRRMPGITNVVLDHRHAAALGLEHLLQLGHRRVAFIKGQPFSSDTETRWTAIREAARKLGLAIDPELVTQLQADTPTPEPGYDVTKALLGKNRHFTAMFAFNDISAIGAIRALLDSGIKVPGDVSVIGFDDIQNAAFQNPRLTTIRQPLRRMGELAAETLLKRIRGEEYPKIVAVEPELIVRESTAAPPLSVLEDLSKAALAVDSEQT
ncbi:MAG TPA: LacI family DNA-binding transcriptional regulator [Terriglobales bacterium]|nr:LacI family DNA-binding transcriptional regulator [Terriglobales bacterium]